MKVISWIVLPNYNSRIVIVIEAYFSKHLIQGSIYQLIYFLYFFFLTFDLYTLNGAPLKH